MLVAVLVLPGAASAQGAPSSCPPLDQHHAAWTELLRRHVRGGDVDYAGLASADRTDLDRYVEALSKVCRRDYDGWSRAAQLAFWIDVYNAFTVRLVLDHYPLGSIREIGILPGAAFRKAIIPMADLEGRTLSLDDVEHRILRPRFEEPRVHFAIVCASRSCPPLRSEAYRAADLDRQLDDQARTFLRDPAKNRWDPQTRTLHLSMIFRWFHEDFETAAGSVAGFVARYLEEPAASAARQPGVRIAYVDYDWSLNGR